jgi:dTDP-glucose pyrophosphorylase
MCKKRAKVINDFWRKAILPNSVTIKDAINTLDTVALKILLITDEKNVLIGTITDGDIRRGLLKGLNLNSSIKDIVNQKSLVVPQELDREMVLQLMTTNKVQQIPIINEKKQVIGLHMWDELNTPKNLSNIMIIMAGGRGERLHPQTLDCPKPMLLFKSKPILEHIIIRAKSNGINHFILAIHYLGHMIEDYFGNGEKFGVKIEYLHEPSPLGTAGALSLLQSKPKETFIVANGDVIIDIDHAQLISYHQENKASATMAVRNYEWQNPYGVVQTQGSDIIAFEEKPITRSYINAGVYALESSALDFLEESIPCDMPSLFVRLKKNSNRIIAFPIHEYWKDLGTPEDFTEINGQ